MNRIDCFVMIFSLAPLIAIFGINLFKFIDEFFLERKNQVKWRFFAKKHYFYLYVKIIAFYIGYVLLFILMISPLAIIAIIQHPLTDAELTKAKLFLSMIAFIVGNFTIFFILIKEKIKNK